MLNNCLKQSELDGCVIHSFRHTLCDYLCAVGCPADIIGAIFGWKALVTNMAKGIALASCMGVPN